MLLSQPHQCFFVIVLGMVEHMIEQKLQRIACSVPEDVYLHSMDDSIMVDAKSFINLFTLDFSEPVKIVTESEEVGKEFQKL